MGDHRAKSSQIPTLCLNLFIWNLRCAVLSFSIWVSLHLHACPPPQHISSRRHKDRAAGKPAKPKFSPYTPSQRHHGLQSVSALFCLPPLALSFVRLLIFLSVFPGFRFIWPYRRPRTWPNLWRHASYLSSPWLQPWVRCPPSPSILPPAQAMPSSRDGPSRRRSCTRLLDLLLRHPPRFCFLPTDQLHNKVEIRGRRAVNCCGPDRHRGTSEERQWADVYLSQE